MRLRRRLPGSRRIFPTPSSKRPPAPTRWRRRANSHLKNKLKPPTGILTGHRSPVINPRYFRERGAGRALVDERYRVYGAAPAIDIRAADDPVRRPVAAFDQHVGLGEPYQGERRIVIEPGHQVYRFERSKQRHAVG